MTNQTQEKFGYPATILHSYEHWSVQLRQSQATLGAMVMICTDPAKQFCDISPAAFAEMKQVVSHIETASRRFCAWDKINYLMLMMVDPDVHFHVLPRYAAARSFAGLTFQDRGWPGPPDLSGGHKPEAELLDQFVAEMKACWPA